MGTLKMRDWMLRDWNFRHQRGQKCKGGKCETGKCSTRKPGVENARLENGAQKMQGWKMREKQTRNLCVWLMYRVSHKKPSPYMSANYIYQKYCTFKVIMHVEV